MTKEITPGKPTTRRYTKEEKGQAVRLVFELRTELGTTQGTVVRIADRLGYGTESLRRSNEILKTGFGFRCVRDSTAHTSNGQLHR
jgi:transposase-like protein